MTISATIQRPTIIKANTYALTSTQSNPDLVLKSVPVSQNYVHSLLDVVESNPANGSTLVYNAATNKYDVKILPVVVTNIDGGTF